MKNDKSITQKQFDINRLSKKHTDKAKEWLAKNDHEAKKKSFSREKLLKAQRVAIDLMANSNHFLNQFQIETLKKYNSQIKNRDSWEEINPKIAERVFKVQFTVRQLIAQSKRHQV